MIDPNWQAALVLLDAPTLRDRTNRYCDHQLQRIKPEILDEISWSTGERQLIELAMSFTSLDYKISLHDAFWSFGPETMSRVIRAFGLVLNNQTTALFFEPQTRMEISL